MDERRIVGGRIGVKVASMASVSPKKEDPQFDLIAKRLRQWAAATGQRLEMTERRLERNSPGPSVASDNRRVGQTKTDLMCRCRRCAGSRCPAAGAALRDATHG